RGLQIGSWLDVGGSGLAGLPPSLCDVRLRWRGVAVSERVAFRPQTLTVEEILDEPNAEVRRVMLERVGSEWFFAQSRAEVLDRAGGTARLSLPLGGEAAVQRPRLRLLLGDVDLRGAYVEGIRGALRRLGQRRRRLALAAVGFAAAGTGLPTCARRFGLCGS